MATPSFTKNYSLSQGGKGKITRGSFAVTEPMLAVTEMEYGEVALFSGDGIGNVFTGTGTTNQLVAYGIATLPYPTGPNLTQGSDLGTIPKNSMAAVLRKGYVMVELDDTISKVDNASVFKGATLAVWYNSTTKTAKLGSPIAATSQPAGWAKLGVDALGFKGFFNGEIDETSNTVEVYLG